MLTYIIDGNNLIGKIPSLMSLQRKDKQASREKLVNVLDRYFFSKKSKVYLHFDGFENGKINSSNLKIVFSDKRSADDKIKNQIGASQSHKNTVVVTSDSNLAQFSKKCSCTIVSSDNFAIEISNPNKPQDEQSIVDSINDVDEFKKLFGV